jgi:uncharacterized repeat protein (TIGR03803 family)
MTRAKTAVLISAILSWTLNVSAQETIIATLATFGITNGTSPYGSLTLASDGNCYGTTTSGGSNGYGTVFELTSNNTFETLAYFDGTNGNYSSAQMLQASNGNFYGVTYVGGMFTLGNVFEFTTNHEILSVHSFDGTNGSYPFGGLVQASNGNIYGTASSGGFGFSNGFGGFGTIFMLTPGGVFSNLYFFTNGSDGSSPLATLAEGTNGNLYGTTYYGGSNGAGVLFELALDPQVLIRTQFSEVTGSAPQCPLFWGQDGNWYGSTTLGGGSANAGTLFRMAPDGLFATLHIFSESGSDGASPVGPLVRCGNDLYGTTYYGGLYSNGIIFRLCQYTNPFPRFESLYSFHDSIDGGYVASGLTVNRLGILLGATLESKTPDGDLAGGTIYEIFKQPHLSHPLFENGQFSFHCRDVQPGVVYQPQYSWTLAPGSWTDLGPPITTLSNRFDFSGAVSASYGYSRVKVFSPWQISLGTAQSFLQKDNPPFGTFTNSQPFR